MKNMERCGFLKIKVLMLDEEIHTVDHYLVLYSYITVESCCDSCGIRMTNGKALICEAKDDNFGICINCYYHGKLDTNLKIMEERLSRVFEGERWWGGSFIKPKARSGQNELVKTIVNKYLEDKNRESQVKEDKTRSDTDNNDKQEINDPTFKIPRTSSHSEQEREVIIDEGVVEEDNLLDEDEADSDSEEEKEIKLEDIQ